MNNILVAQSGGPTAAINASLVGVVEAAKVQGYDRVYGSLHGIRGVLDSEIIDMTDMSKEELDTIRLTPSSYLGSCRYRLERDTDDMRQILETFKELQIAAFFYIGGNDSMDTVMKLTEYGESVGTDIQFVGVPKTIDNDLVFTDHAPGYGSAAKYIAASMLEIAHDTAVYKLPCVTIVEIMGRDEGWLTAAAALARNEDNRTPQLIYMPEVTFSRRQFLDDVKECLTKTDNVIVAVSEGVRDSHGEYICARTAARDRFGHVQLSGAGKYLEFYIRDELGIKCRSVELNILQRCAGHIASATDIDESYKLGRAAVSYAAGGATGVMVGLVRRDGNGRDTDVTGVEVTPGQYSCDIMTGDIRTIANATAPVPRAWISEAGNDVTQEFIDYARPLIMGETGLVYRDGLPVYATTSQLC